MARAAERTYRTAAFAALAGVTTRALRHYDRLGLLKPRRSSSGYRLYVERDLETLEEIVALKFIGVPLKAIPGARRRSTGLFAYVLRAQRAALEGKRQVLSKAIEAIGRAEASLSSGFTVDATLFRHIIEVMQMDANHEETLAKYSAMLKAKMTHLRAMSPARRQELRESWATLTSDIRSAIAAQEQPEAQEQWRCRNDPDHQRAADEPARAHGVRGERLTSQIFRIRRRSSWGACAAWVGPRWAENPGS
jgi:DNA-binding transcriptional MerR regulator